MHPFVTKNEAHYNLCGFHFRPIYYLQKSSLVGSTPFDSKKSKVTVQRPGEQKAYQCGPNSKKNKKTESVSVLVIFNAFDQPNRQYNYRNILTSFVFCEKCPTIFKVLLMLVAF